MVFPTEGILEVTIESWSEWDLNPQPLISLLTDLPIRFFRHSYRKLAHIYKLNDQTFKIL